MDSEHNLLVSIPADIQTNDQAALCFQSGWASASATHGLADSAKKPIQKFKTGTWLDFPMVTPLVWWSPEQVTQSYGLPGKVVPAKDGSKSWVYEWKSENTLVQLTFGFDPAGHMTMWVMSQVVLDKRQEKPTPEPSVSPKKRTINRDPLVGPLAAFLLVVAALAPIWVLIPVAIVVSPWILKRTWDNRKL